MIAGFERPDAGTIELAGERRLAAARRSQRDVNTVFQDYALFPHMSVADNVGYGLRVEQGAAQAERAPARRRGARDGAAARASAAASPAQLSGGQRQRVALARAIVNRPQVLLLDEPLGALDLKLRQEMQVELKRIQQEVGITFVYVTHDQEEALTMSDRLAVFNDGPDRAGRRARRGLRAPAQRVHRRLRRRLERARARRPAVHDPAREGPAARRAARRPAHRGGRGARRRLRGHGHALPGRPRATAASCRSCARTWRRRRRRRSSSRAAR